VAPTSAPLGLPERNLSTSQGKFTGLTSTSWDGELCQGRTRGIKRGQSVPQARSQVTAWYDRHGPFWAVGQLVRQSFGPGCVDAIILTCGLVNPLTFLALRYGLRGTVRPALRARCSQTANSVSSEIREPASVPSRWWPAWLYPLRECKPSADRAGTSFLGETCRTYG
jgi:hypothetical protein